MEAFENVFQCPAQAMRGKWGELYFRNNHPIILELGCGHGDYTVGLAERYPDKNFIGIDIKGARMWQGAKEAIARQLHNVAFLRINIEMLEYFFTTDEIAEIWITFPDPQMKKATKRLTSTYFMARYQNLLRSGGLIHLKTDSPFLYTYTQAMLTDNDYPIICDSADLYAEPLTPAIEEARALQTHYEHQWLERGLTIKYLCWALVPKQALVEPTIEIPKDNYRSYGRNYVSTTNH